MCDLPPGIKADVYCEPMVVIEVKAAQRTQSDLYGGWSLRFPRFIRRRKEGLGYFCNVICLLICIRKVLLFVLDPSLGI